MPFQPPQQAVEAPRWLYGRSWGEASSSLTLEGRFAPAVFEELARDDDEGNDEYRAAVRPERGGVDKKAD